jgi:hypothetical protein
VHRFLTDIGIDLGALVLLTVVALFAAPMLYGFWRGRKAPMIAVLGDAVRHDLMTFALAAVAVGWIASGALDDGLPGGAAGAVSAALVAACVLGARRAVSSR